MSCTCGPDGTTFLLIWESPWTLSNHRLPDSFLKVRIERAGNKNLYKMYSLPFVALLFLTVTHLSRVCVCSRVCMYACRRVCVRACMGACLCVFVPDPRSASPMHMNGCLIAFSESSLCGLNAEFQAKWHLLIKPPPPPGPCYRPKWGWIDGYQRHQVHHRQYVISPLGHGCRPWRVDDERFVLPYQTIVPPR